MLEILNNVGYEISLLCGGQDTTKMFAFVVLVIIFAIYLSIDDKKMRA